MNIFITGTPGTGKTTISKLLKEQLPINFVDINQLVDDEKLYTGYDEKKGYKIVDIPALCLKLKDIIRNTNDDKDMLVEGHLSHFCDGADLVIILRTHPDTLQNRLKDKGFNNDKIRENLEAEALDICAFETFERYGDNANEIDTSDENPQEIVNLIKMIMKGKKHFSVGEVDFSDYFFRK